LLLDWRQVLEAEFASHRTDRVWRGQVAAIDGVIFKMVNPGCAVPNPGAYFVARKDEFGLLCIATCDYHRRFLSYDISQASTTHDSMAHAASELGKQLASGRLHPDFFINGDSAFTRAPHMVIPGGGDAYDYVQSSTRMPIECAFGILVRRWGVLWRPLSVRFDRRAPLIGACMRLHNLCIDERITEETCFKNGLGEVQPGRWERVPKFDREGRPVEYLDTAAANAPPPEPRMRRAVAADAGKRRQEALAQAIRNAGIARPALQHGLRKKKRRRRAAVAARS
jgi:hypothetical protein